jgi:hypothetical protein
MKLIQAVYKDRENACLVSIAEIHYDDRRTNEVIEIHRVASVAKPRLR